MSNFVIISVCFKFFKSRDLGQAHSRIIDLESVESLFFIQFKMVKADNFF